MSTAFSEVDGVTHAVALNRLQARRGDVAAPVPNAPNPGFADTVPLWFRSEAFAEDVTDPVRGTLVCATALNDSAGGRTDERVLVAGAAVLRKTLQALGLQRW